VEPFESGSAKGTGPAVRAGWLYAVEGLRAESALWARKALSSSILEMIGSPPVTGRELQEFPSRAREATLASQFAEPVRYFSIVRAVRRRSALLSPARR
jgi:hypothetical protein